MDVVHELSRIIHVPANTLIRDLSAKTINTLIDMVTNEDLFNSFFVRAIQKAVTVADCCVALEWEPVPWSIACSGPRDSDPVGHVTEAEIGPLRSTFAVKAILAAAPDMMMEGAFPEELKHMIHVDDNERFVEAICRSGVSRETLIACIVQIKRISQTNGQLDQFGHGSDEDEDQHEDEDEDQHEDEEIEGLLPSGITLSPTVDLETVVQMVRMAETTGSDCGSVVQENKMSKSETFDTFSDFEEFAAANDEDQSICVSMALVHLADRVRDITNQTVDREWTEMTSRVTQRDFYRVLADSSEDSVGGYLYPVNKYASFDDAAIQQRLRDLVCVVLSVGKKRTSIDLSMRAVRNRILDLATSAIAGSGYSPATRVLSSLAFCGIVRHVTLENIEVAGELEGLLVCLGEIITTCLLSIVDTREDLEAEASLAVLCVVIPMLQDTMIDPMMAHRFNAVDASKTIFAAATVMAGSSKGHRTFKLAAAVLEWMTKDLNVRTTTMTSLIGALDASHQEVPDRMLSGGRFLARPIPYYTQQTETHRLLLAQATDARDSYDILRRTVAAEEAQIWSGPVTETSKKTRAERAVGINDAFQNAMATYDRCLLQTTQDRENINLWLFTTVRDKYPSVMGPDTSVVPIKATCNAFSTFAGITGPDPQTALVMISTVIGEATFHTAVPAGAKKPEDIKDRFRLWTSAETGKTDGGTYTVVTHDAVPERPMKKEGSLSLVIQRALNAKAESAM